MNPKTLYDDSRPISTCVYCGGAPETSEHVPSEMLLDEPVPQDVPEVPACQGCHTDLSQHVEYLACLVDSVLAGTTEVDKLGRKGPGALRRSQSLQASVDNARIINDAGAVYWRPDNSRVRTVVLMLARGHAAYMLSEPQYHEPDVLEILPLERMSEAARREFEAIPEVTIWPERGPVRTRPGERWPCQRNANRGRAPSSATRASLAASRRSRGRQSPSDRSSRRTRYIGSDRSRSSRAISAARSWVRRGCSRSLPTEPGRARRRALLVRGHDLHGYVGHDRAPAR